MTEESIPESGPATSLPPSGKRRRRPDRAAGSHATYRHRNRTVLVPAGHMAIGRIVGVHGLNGELRVELHTDFPERFATDGTVLLGEGLRAYRIAGAREHKGMVLLSLAGVTDRESAEALREEWLFIAEGDANPLPEGEYWVHDVIGLAVVDEAGSAVGTISDILQTGANDVYIITPAAGVNRDKELLIPAIAEVVRRVDVPGGTMTIRLIPGLLED